MYSAIAVISYTKSYDNDRYFHDSTSNLSYGLFMWAGDATSTTTVTDHGDRPPLNKSVDLQDIHILWQSVCIFFSCLEKPIATPYQVHRVHVR